MLSHKKMTKLCGLPPRGCWTHGKALTRHSLQKQVGKSQPHPRSDHETLQAPASIAAASLAKPPCETGRATYPAGMVSELQLSDSYDRLGWVRALASRVDALGAQMRDEVQRAGLRCDELVVDGTRHVRFRLPPVEVPAELRFLVADLCVNARSCLDMAMEHIAASRAPGWRRPQFPIGGLDVAANDGYYKAARKHLPPAYFQVVAEAQPYTHQSLGFHQNLTGVLIHKLSNANKHRNITPVVHAKLGNGFNSPDPSVSDLVTYGGGPWPNSPRDEMTVMTLSVPADAVGLAAIMAWEPTTSDVLTIVLNPREGIYPWREVPWMPIRLNPMVGKVPLYVQMVLDNFRTADRWVTRGETYPLRLAAYGDV